MNKYCNTYLLQVTCMPIQKKLLESWIWVEVQPRSHFSQDQRYVYLKDYERNNKLM